MSVWAYYLIAKAIKVFASLWCLSKISRIQSEFQKQNKALNMLLKKVRMQTIVFSDKEVPQSHCTYREMDDKNRWKQKSKGSEVLPRFAEIMPS